MIPEEDFLMMVETWQQLPRVESWKVMSTSTFGRWEWGGRGEGRMGRGKREGDEEGMRRKKPPCHSISHWFHSLGILLWPSSHHAVFPLHFPPSFNNFFIDHFLKGVSPLCLPLDSPHLREISGTFSMSLFYPRLPALPSLLYPLHSSNSIP